MDEGIIDGIDQLDREALEAWIKHDRQTKKKNKINSTLVQDSNNISKIVNMYNVYGSKNSALVRPKDNAK
jgi:alkyl hydroperoxide reductase subunit AhpC